MAEKVELFHEVIDIGGHHIAVEMRECVGRKTFKSLLKDSISNWEHQGKMSVSIKFPVEFAHLAEIAAQEGFEYQYHRVERDYLLLKKQFASFEEISKRWLFEAVNALSSLCGEVPCAEGESVATLVDYSDDYIVPAKSPPEFFNLTVANIATTVRSYTAAEEKTAASWTRDDLPVDGLAFLPGTFQVAHFVPTGSVRRGEERSKCHGPAPGSGSRYAFVREPKAAISQTRDALPTHGSALVAGTFQLSHTDPRNMAGSGLELQRQNIFWGICLIRQKPCTFIIDSGCSCNIIRESLIEELNLSWAPLPSPTSIGLMDSKQQVQVSRQARVPFAMHEYADCMLFTALTDPPADLVLGRPWSWDVRAKHDCYENQYKFQRNGMDITLYPLMPSEVAHLHNKINGTSSRGE